MSKISTMTFKKSTGKQMNQFEANAEEAEQWLYIKRKLRVGEKLTKSDRQKLITLLEISEMDTIPSLNAINNYRNHYKLFLTTDESAPAAIKDKFEKVYEFEKRFIEPFRNRKSHYEEG